MPLRGGNFNNGASSGVFALNLNNARANSNNNIGFRAAFSRSQMLQAHGLASSTEKKKELVSAPSIFMYEVKN